MGCFGGCFGGSKDAKPKKRRNKVIPKDQRRFRVQSPPQNVALPEQAPQPVAFPEHGVKEIGKSPDDLVPELRNKTEESLSASPRKRVTFNSNVTAYEPVSVYGSAESLPDTGKVSENGKERNSVKSKEDNSSSGDDSVTSSVGSYPPNHRYQNCRESDDEAEECADSDLDDDDEDEDDVYDEDVDDGIVTEGEVWSESVITASMESRTKNSLIRMNSEEVNSPLKAPGLADQGMKANMEKGYVRDRSGYIHSVLNPVENLTQWKTVKSNGTRPVKPQKENFSADLESKQSSSISKSIPDLNTNCNQEIAVDASLSNWLVSPETTPCKKTSYGGGLETIASGRSGQSQGSNSVVSFEDRPILGALTVEELKQMSASSSKRRSPSRSPDDMPIIGSVGTYWNDSNSGNASNSATSFKGIPNTTSKYREDKRVNWHSTPFETRLERALNKGATEA